MSAFDRDATIAIINEYYHFLTTMYLDETEVIQPPPGGWPNITLETMRPLGKTDAVVDLLRHLPHVRCSGDDGPQIAPHARCAAWSTLADSSAKHSDAWGVLALTDGWDSSDRNACAIHGGAVPPYCVGLTSAGRDDAVFLLDTEWGCVWWIDCPDEIRYSGAVFLSSDGNGESQMSGSESPTTTSDSEEDDSEVDQNEDVDDTDDDDDDDDNDPEWIRDGWHPQWPIPVFFAKLKKHFQQLDFVPKDSENVLEGWSRNDRNDTGPRLADKLKPFYRKHGWPDLELYRKGQCLEDVRKVGLRHDAEIEQSVTGTHTRLLT